MEIAASDLILTDTEGEAAADELLAALSDLAYATPTTTVRPKRKFKSRFFFRISRAIAVDVAEHKKRSTAKVMEHVDAEVEKRLKTYKTEAPEAIATNIKSVREFFLNVIGPRSLASSAGSSQAREVVQRLLNTEIDATQFDKFERMSHEAVNILMAKFVAQYYGLPVKAAYRILVSIQPRQPMSLPIPAQAPQTYESRHAKGRKDVQARQEGTNKGQE